MGTISKIATTVAGLALVLTAIAPAQADEYGMRTRAKRHYTVTHVHHRHYAACAERVVVREVGYRYYPRAQIYSYEPQEYVRVYCAPVTIVN